MKQTLFTLMLFLATLLAGAQVIEETTPEQPKLVLDAQVYFIWEGEGNVRIEIEGKEYYLKNKEPKEVALKAGKSYELKLLKPGGKEYFYDDYLDFKKGKDIVYINLTEQSGEGKVTAIKLSTAASEAIKEIEQSMVKVEGGKFTMGCTSEQSDCDDDEKPAHMVSIGDYYLCKYEVTQQQWQAIMGTNPSYFQDCDNCPVEQVSWEDVQEFIGKLNLLTDKTYRLPTEAEWEYAARGGGVESHGRATLYAGSNNISDVAWYSGNSGSTTHPVGQKQPNELGLYHMSGNVFEWCADWFDANYYASSPANNPKGPSSGSYRVFRGGSWSSNASVCRVASRYGRTPYYRFSSLGFRLSMDVNF